ncbi:MAG: glycosyltransferase family 39 protein [Bacteroidales bacterium]|nr:glycosyltransferase family 39 protein [Bacteroidales bacterium]
MENGKRKNRKHHLRSIRNKTSRKLDYILLGVVLLVAAVLRLWKLGQVPFMHDEFSALFRLQYDNFKDLIQYGVKPDSHPAGVQVFLYFWTQLVGWNEFWVKLPFALMGIGSVYLIYVIGKQWFNRKTGLLAAAFFAVSQITVFYSQLARPYAPGLFFVLLMTYFWNKLLFDFKKPSVGTCIGMAVAACLAALAHNFSAAQAGLIFITGLFFLRKERRKAYWLSGIGAFLLYAPHLPLFYHQTFVYGSIGGWLSRPGSSFLVDFFQYTMNYAPLFIFTAGFLIIQPFILHKPEKRRLPIRWAAVSWFVIIFLLAFVYSLVREPIIQFSTLLFSFPFLVIAAFSLYRNNTMTQTETIISISAILFIGTMTLITNRRHYELMYHQGYDQIALRMEEDSHKLQDIRFATFTEAAKMPEFYQGKTDIDERTIFDYDNNIGDFRNWLREGTSEKLGFAWTDYAIPIWETQAVAYYPWKIHEDTWFTSRYLTLSRDSVPGAVNLLKPLSATPMSFVSMEWGEPLYISGDTLDNDIDILGVTATIQTNDTLGNCGIIIEIRDAATDSLLVWQGNNEQNGFLLPGENVIANAVRFDKKHFPPQGKNIKIYLWNPLKGTMIARDFRWYSTKFNARLAGLYQPL